MQSIVSQIHRILIKSKKTISIAESCTGGLTSSLLTRITGSSLYFTLGIVAYDNKIKENILNIPGRIIARKGAVSKDVAERMAKAARKLANADFGIGVTGIAGPSGATPGKPVGTVFIAIDSKDNKICRKFIFTGNRITIRKKAALKALELLKRLT
ncbi:MAG: CinA family protein [Candidatus Omnitrophota bacterium]